MLHKYLNRLKSMSTKWGNDLHLKIIGKKPKVSVFRIPLVTVIYAPQVLEQIEKYEYQMGQGFALENDSDKAKSFSV